MLDLDMIDGEEIAAALADQTDYEHRWLIQRDPGASGPTSKVDLTADLSNWGWVRASSVTQCDRRPAWPASR
jgi:hypothetical protein